MLAGAIAGAGLAAWQGLWQHIADEVRLARALPVARAASAWVAVEHDETALAEGALGLQITLRGVSAAGTIAGQNWRWQVGEVVVTLPASPPRTLDIVLPAPQKLTASGPLGRASAVLWARNLTATVTLDEDGTVATVALDGEDLTLVAADFEAAATSARLATDASGDGLVLALALGGITLPQAWRPGPPLDVPVAAVTAAVVAHGIGPPLPGDAAAWRDAGGRLEVTELTLAWGPLAVSGEGHVRLDAALRPEGRARVALSGLRTAIDAAAVWGLLSETWHRVASATVNRLVQMRGAEAGDHLALGLAMAGGVLSWSGLPIAVLPALGDDSAP